ncbi:hypothetical protein [Rhodococcus qingshengii]
MTSTFRRDAAVLAAYLAQFDNTETGPADNHTASTALSPEQREQRRRDCQQATIWASASTVSDDDLAALTGMRQRYGFPSQSRAR